MKTISTRNSLLGASLAIALIAVAAPASATLQEDADALLAAQDWDGAASAYEALLAGEADNAANWYSLGQARRSLGDFDGAIAAYRRALELQYTPAGRVQYNLARALMASGDREAALEQLETLAQSGVNLGRVVSGTAEFESLAEEPRFVAVVAALTPCTAPEFRHFDFWLGEWDVTGGGSPQPTATNSITATQGGCVVFEQYTAGAFTGMSINFYDAARETWRQTWMSNGGGAVYLEGGLNENGEMVMSDANLPSSTASGTINRVTWTPNPDGSVRQFWQSSSDGGATWTTAFDGLYTRQAAD